MAGQTTSSPAKPLAGIRVLEFTHMVMGPACGMVLADLGADVIKIEPAPAGDNTRRLGGVGVGFFATFNRNKRSLSVDLKSARGIDLVRKLALNADVIVENFREGAMDKLGLGYAALSELNPRLIYCACKGFLPGPYSHRAALDEVVQMMGGLAYMTGQPGRPTRAGSSVNDIMGGMFGVIAVMAALRQRDVSGKGALVQTGLFETNMVLMAQHMAYVAIEGRDPKPFGDPELGRPWPVYDVFDTSEAGEQIFVGAVTDSQWRSLCLGLELTDLLEDPNLQSMAALAADRPRILARVGGVFRTKSKSELMALFERLGLAYAPIARPSDMMDDEHLVQSGALLCTDVSSARDGQPANSTAPLPGLPILLGSERFSLQRQPPRIGENSIEAAKEAGLSEAEIAELLETGVIVAEVPERTAEALSAM